MYSKITVARHPVHPALVAFPVAFYTGSLVGFAVYVANNHQFWLNLAIAASIAGAGTAILAAVPGFVDWLLGVPRHSQAKIVGAAHGGLNLVALGLFIAVAVRYVGHWNGPATDATLGLALSALGVALTIAAGAMGWTLVQTFHIGVSLTDAQCRDEDIVHLHVPGLMLASPRRN
ncbi:DUF2231 domain-containing protein [Skermania sp. ID1734]|uniref:DUF2231 domain-containing protein n=1 Tax=Skermania sp. ID1734 TaxID=2597516 RepID=UPI00117FF33C|nr:DUF2231 domain-containing protein [Skermania sp. ID1734]TSD98103.1 DUF2231 domain-containing protein [Skermania sp. ID1734]